MAHALEIKDVTKKYVEHLAVDRLSLAVPTGSIYGILGPNGAGKSTTLRMVMNIIARDAGSIAVLGRDPASDRDVLRRVGYLPEERGLYKKMTVIDVIVFFGALRGMREADVRQKGVKWLDKMGLADWQKARVDTLSKGMQQKVQFITTVIHAPDLLILDEPTSGLDPLLQHEFLSLVEESVADGVTVFLSSHVLPEVERIADRIGILRRGELVSLGGIDDVRPRQRLDLHLASDPPGGAFEGVPGVMEVEVHGNVVSLLVEGSADAVIKAAAQHTVERVVSHETDLEDAFLELYRNPSGDGGEER